MVASSYSLPLTYVASTTQIQQLPEGTKEQALEASEEQKLLDKVRTCHVPMSRREVADKRLR